MLSLLRSSAYSAVALALSLSPLVAQSALQQELNDDLGLRRSDIVEVVIQGQPGQPVDAALQINGHWTALRLRPHSVRASGFELRAQGSDGSWRSVPPGPLVTMRGEVEGHDGSRVAAALLEDGLHARILFDDGQDFWLQPVANARTAAGQLHVLYRDADVMKNGSNCGADLIPGNKPVAVADRPAGGSLAGFVAELGCDADYEYFLDYGSVTAVGNRIQSVINTVNLQYDSQVDIEHAITTILVRTSSNQPYTSSDAVTILNQFRTEWLVNQGGIQRDVAQLFTGKSIIGSTIGIAWVGAVCTTFGFGMVESDFNNNFSCATDLSAHELGHNWNAPHCSCPTFTMNPSITCANNFNSGTISTITAFRNSRSCLSSGGPTNQAPTVNAGADQTITLPAVANLDGTVSDDGLPNPPGQVSTTWSVDSGPGSVTFGNANAIDTTASFSAAGSYVVRLTADDGALISSDTVAITVQSGGTEVQIAFDDFESASGSGGTGWSAPWAGAGDVRLQTGAGPHSPIWHVRLRRRTGLAQRQVDLSGVTNAKLVYWGKLNSFENPDQALVRVSTNGGATFTTVQTLGNGDDDNVYHRYEIPLGTVSNQTVVRFDAEMSGGRDYWYIDDIEIRGVR